MDLKKFVPEVVGASPNQIREMADLGLDGLTRGLHRLKKPVIGAVNGWALAAGFELAFACDIRIASERAIFGSFAARRGFHHGDGGIPRLVNMHIHRELAPAIRRNARPDPVPHASGWKMIPNDLQQKRRSVLTRKIQAP